MAGRPQHQHVTVWYLLSESNWHCNEGNGRGQCKKLRGSPAFVPAWSWIFLACHQVWVETSVMHYNTFLYCV